MTYPQLDELPLSIGAAAQYSMSLPEDGGPDLYELFTRKDKYGEEYLMYEKNLVNYTIMVPRNCAPEVTEKQAEELYHMTVGKKTYNWADGFVPRDDEQLRMVEASVKLLLHGGRSGHIMQAPTGYGKTYLGSAVIQRIGVRTLVLTTKEDLLDAWKIALNKTLNIDPDQIGEWRGDVVPLPHHEVVVGLVQSVCKGVPRYTRELYESFGMVMVDEVQRMGADKFSRAMWWLPARFRLGLSATPYRKDGREEVFHAHIGEVLVSTEERTLIPKVICVDTEWEVPEVWQFDPSVGKNIYGPLDIPWGRAIVAAKHLAADERRTDIIVRFMHSALKKGRNTVIMSDTVDHLQRIKEALVASGIKDKEGMFGWYVGLSNDVYKGEKDRKAAREKAKLARIGLATFKMCSEGTNVPWWDTEVLATPKADVEQPVGRILREWEDKRFPVVLDLCDYSHIVTGAFAKKRQKWYESIGAEIVHK